MCARRGERRGCQRENDSPIHHSISMDVPREVHLATASGIDWLILVRVCLRETENVGSEYVTVVNAFADAAELW